MDRPPSSSRREFLSGRAAARSLRDLAEKVTVGQETLGDPAGTASPAARATYLLECRRDAMATVFEVLLNAGQYPNAMEAAVESLDLIERLEDQLTVYREHSEVSQINRLAAQSPTPVERRLFELLALAVEIHAQTRGAYDITAGALSQVWGFSRRQGRLPDEEELGRAKLAVGSDGIELDERRGTIAFKEEGLTINLGSIGKGYALDRAGACLRDMGVDDFLLHCGQSSVLAQGDRLDGSGTQGWRVGVSHPLRPDVRLAEIRLANQGLGTSGSGKQFFHHEGRRLSHILDSRTGWPAEGVLSATVVASDATLADALSTAFFVLGPDESLEICRLREDLAVLFVLPGEREGRLHLVDHGFQEGQLTLL
jgi:thiamine biosynthesis lipoprotein